MISTQNMTYLEFTVNALTFLRTLATHQRSPKIGSYTLESLYRPPYLFNEGPGGNSGKVGTGRCGPDRVPFQRPRFTPFLIENLLI